MIRLIETKIISNLFANRLPTSFIITLHFYFTCLVGSILAGNPFTSEISSNWAEFSGNKEAKIVYMTRVSDEIIVKDLLTGESKKIADFAVAHTVYGLSGSVKWSSDGKRITMQNDLYVKVMNADGSKVKTIASTKLDGDLIVHSWSSNEWIVYSTGKKIKRSKIDEDNSVIETEELVSDPPGGGIGYSSVTMSGDYLAYVDMLGNRKTGGGHRPIVLNVKTGESRDVVARNSDGCQLRIKSDGLGTVMYCEWTHNKAAKIKNWEGNLIDTIPIIEDPVENNAIQHMRWSNDTNYIIVMGALREPKHAWAVRMTDKKWLYLGDDSYHPDLWINNANIIPISHHAKMPQLSKRITVTNFSTGILKVQSSEKSILQIRLYNPKGMLLFEKGVQGKSTCFVPLSNYNKGIYILVVKTPGTVIIYKTFVLVK